MSFTKWFLMLSFLTGYAPLTHAKDGRDSLWAANTVTRNGSAARIQGQTHIVDDLEAEIIRLSPAVKPRARQIARFISEFSPLPHVTVAILMQESGFRDVHVLIPGLDVVTHEYRQVYKDLGIAQINAGTALEFRCNIDKLIQHDLRESIRCHSTVLRAKLKMCEALADEAYSCYNSTTDGPRKAYLRAVQRWLKINKK